MPSSCVPGMLRDTAGHKVKIMVDSNASPRFHKAQPVLYMMRDKLDTS